MFSRRKIKQLLTLITTLVLSRVVAAQGLDVVEATTTNVFDVLDTIGTPLVAIAIIVGGVLLIFRRASMELAGGIIIGGILIGGAAELAAFVTGG